MVHRPKTVYGNVLLFLVALGIVRIVVSVTVALSGALFWGALAATALACIVLYAWRRRVDAARERAWTGSFSFGDVVARRRAKDVLQLAAERAA
jgi:hypothetical protein